ncbi:MAG: pentapeptide repeat-containing protein [Ferrovibrio sp.]|uniref:pentapeptide repeat-containing protein n=1 Tax=Ferrovibrio sp. TaxID=1917215 RepID=UPI00391B592C
MLSRILDFFENNVFIRLVVRFGQTVGWVSAAIAATAFFYTYAKDQRSADEAARFQAWTLVNMQSGREGNGGQIAALERLVKDGAIMRGLKMDRAYLDRINMRGAIADESSFVEASMHGANLSYGHFMNANFSKAEMSGALLIAFNNPDVGNKLEIRPVKIEQKSEPVDPRDETPLPFSYHRKYFGVRFSGANLIAARFTNADLRSARFDDADLSMAVLVRADLRHAKFDGANLSYADISGANFGNGSDMATITQDQIDRTCADRRLPPVLPDGLRPPRNECARDRWAF